MFNFGKARIGSTRAEDAEPFPRLGGHPVRRRAALHSLVIALTLVAATAGATLAIASATEETKAAAVGSTAETGHAGAAPVRTTGKADRLKPPFRPQTCNGVWGNEPLECLAQTV